MVRVFVHKKAINHRQTIEVLFTSGVQFDFRADVDFIAFPAFDCDRSIRRARNRHRSAIGQAVNLVPRRRARQHWRLLRRLLIFLRCDC